MAQKDAKEKVVDDWLSASADDLESARVLYDNCLFAYSLYHLQQSNEKMAKALLLRLGFLTPKTARKDWAVKSVLGFLPKEPARYRHRTLAYFLSDLEKSVPAIEALFKRMESSEFGPSIAEFHGTIRRSKKGIRKLKKKPFSPVGTAEQLEEEIKAARGFLGAIDAVIDKATEEAKKIDPERAVRIATRIVEKAGFNVQGQQSPPFDEIVTTVMASLRLTLLATLSVAMASLLDPLESITRYPDSQHGRFDENNPYVKQFKGLYEVTKSILEKSRNGE